MSLRSGIGDTLVGEEVLGFLAGVGSRSEKKIDRIAKPSELVRFGLDHTVRFAI